MLQMNFNHFRRSARCNKVSIYVFFMKIRFYHQKLFLFVLQKLDPHTAKAIEEFLEKLRSFAVGNSSFSFILDDPTGNSFIENP